MRKTNLKTLAINLFFLVISFQSAHAKNELIKLPNIGFHKNPPVAWVNKYQMCDKFLKVKWIDKDKKIGHVRYDIYQNNIRKGQMTALVYLNHYFPSFTYDVYKYEKKKKLKELFSFIRKGKIIGYDEQLVIRLDDKKISFWNTLPINPVKATIANNQLNVCIVYPDQKLAWIAEGKKVERIYNSKKIKEILAGIQKTQPKLSYDWFKNNYNVVDLNFDGVDDFFSKGVIYSIEGKYQTRRRIRTYFEVEKYFEYNFPPYNKKCKKPYGGTYLTTDGKRYFDSNECDLTEQTTK